jgi:hypothetical protein
MLLSPKDAKRFIRLHQGLMWYVNQVLDVVPQEGTFPVALEDRPALREAFVENADLLFDFIDENPFDLPANDLKTLQSWKHFQFGDFLVMECLEQHNVLLSFDEVGLAYGALSLTEPLSDLIPGSLPILVETMLLPFNGKIVFDGLLVAFDLDLDDNYFRSFEQVYSMSKEIFGIVTTLPVPTFKRAPKKPRAKRSTKRQ